VKIERLASLVKNAVRSSSNSNKQQWCNFTNKVIRITCFTSEIRRKNQRKSKKQPQTERQFGSVRVEALQTNPDRTLPAAVGRERALEFLQQQLYQSNRYRRIPAISFHSQKCRNKPAAIFV
jgi:hypothetical protein